MGLFYKKIVFIFVLAAFTQPTQGVALQTEKEDESRGRLLVDVAWLQKHMDDPGIVIIDARTPEDYAKGHIAGAINLPASRTYQSRYIRVLSQNGIETLLGGLGIRNGDYVLIYGSAIYEDAARVLWALDVYGHAKLSVLNGAYPAWQAAGLPVNTRLPFVKPVKYRATIHPDKMATRLQTLLAINNPHIMLIDARVAAEYHGIQSRARRFGHIPSAVNIAKDRNMEVRQDVSYIKPWPVLEALYADVSHHDKAILYCNTGTEAAIAYLLLQQMGKNVSVYDGAWHEWGNDPGLPVELSAM